MSSEAGPPYPSEPPPDWVPESLSVGLTPPGGVSNSSPERIGPEGPLRVKGAEQRWQRVTPSGFAVLQSGQIIRRKPSEG
jgi:hypothetical protein